MTSRNERLSRVGAALFAALTLCVVLGTRPAHADEQRPRPREVLPAGTASNLGAMPPYVPPSVPAGVTHAERAALALDWVAAARAVLSRVEPQRDAPDVLLACAFLERNIKARWPQAAADLAAARDAYAAGEPFRAVAILELARLELARGHPRAALDHREALTRFDQSGGLLNPSTLDQMRESTARRHFDLYWPRAEAKMLAGIGKLEEAARVLEAGSARLPDPGRRARRLERAARYYARARKPVAALGAIDAATRHVEAESRQADLAFWRLHIEHGVIDTNGSPALLSTWPGTGFTQGVMGYLDHYGHLASTAEQHLAFGSFAHTAGQDEIALEIYRRALANPHLEDRFRNSPSLLAGLLVMVPVAIRLKRYDEAQRFLDAVTRMGGGKQKLRDQLEIRLREARAADKQPLGTQTPTPAAPPERAPEDRTPSELLGHVPPVGGDSGDAHLKDRVPAQPTGGTAATPRTSLVLLLVLPGLLLLCLVWLRVMRTRL